MIDKVRLMEMQHFLLNKYESFVQDSYVLFETTLISYQGNKNFKLPSIYICSIKQSLKKY